jgi:hypothetical protein
MVYTLVLKKWIDDTISIKKIIKSELKIKKAFFIKGEKEITK